ncbi:hypothetical protein ACFYY2_20940 [Streptomyces sp. NPDC001822]|uniref:hypothetical protein n=1 Tax=Streptomyces sp. NPDC001822 TaxID=3364614 RepID=UPI00367A9DF7
MAGVFEGDEGVDAKDGTVRRPVPQGRTGRAAMLLLPLLGSLGLALGPAGAAPAEAASGCSGRLAKTVRFATGSLRVYESRSYACAVAVAVKPGARRTMRVSLQPRGGRAVVDSGTFTTMAGPVTVHALNRCVRASGAVAGSSVSTGWILC